MHQINSRWDVLVGPFQWRPFESPWTVGSFDDPDHDEIVADFARGVAPSDEQHLTAYRIDGGEWVNVCFDEWDAALREATDEWFEDHRSSQVRGNRW